MKFQLKALVVVAALALSATPALAAGRDDHPTGPPERAGKTPPKNDGAPKNDGTPRNDGAPKNDAAPKNDGTAHKPATPGPKAKAHGTYCEAESKKHVKGEKGTAFSRCVKAMAKLANGTAKNPRTACKDLSKKHVKGEKGTPFSRCVSGGAKLLEDQDEAAEEEAATAES